MKLSKLYSNKPNLFKPIEFSQGLNVIMAEIRLPGNRNEDTHNLGKSTLGRLLDFGFLAKRNPNFFLFKHYDLFKEFIFFLEIELEENSFITIRRSVKEASKISFKRHQASRQDLSRLALTEWDHENVSFDIAKTLLDGVLDWRATKPWGYRQALGYLLRSQNDFTDVFKLLKFQRNDFYWKPFLAHILGFDAEPIDEYYKKEAQLKEKEKSEKIIKNELGQSVENINKIEGVLLIKQKDAEKKQEMLDAFDFHDMDKESTKQLVDEVDVEIASLNAERYSHNLNKKKITSSLKENRILFNPDEAQRLFEEAGVLFNGQIKKDFQQLLEFNQAITDERREYLQEESKEIDAELKRINKELESLGRKRLEMLSFLSEIDIFDKYKQASDDMVILRADITSLERQRDSLHRLQKVQGEIGELKKQCIDLKAKIETDVGRQSSNQESLFSQIRLFFSEIVEEVTGRKALLSVYTNKNGKLEFNAELLDESGDVTSADKGNSYQKLLCIAFDLSVLRAHLNEEYPRFVYHDGVFEGLDDRKKEKLLTVIRDYADLGLQPIITLIDSDLPLPTTDAPVFSPDEVVLTLHDEGDQGLLFKMKSW